MINNFKSIIETATNDNSAMNSKRSLETRQECLDVTDVEQCIADISEIVEDPSEILGRKKKRHLDTAMPTSKESVMLSEA